MLKPKVRKKANKSL